MRLKKIFASFLLMALVFVSANGLSPAVANAGPAQCSGTSSSLLNFPTWYKYVDHGWNPETNGCDVRARIPDDLAAIGFAIFEIILRIAGIAAVFFVMYGGFLYLTSQGEPDRAANGRTTIVNALTGLLIAMLATAIVNLVARNIT
jgi:hypothetical protein